MGKKNFNQKTFCIFQRKMNFQYFRIFSLLGLSVNNFEYLKFEDDVIS